MHLNTLPAGVIGGGCGMQTLQYPALQVGQMHALISCTTGQCRLFTGGVCSNVKGPTVNQTVQYLFPAVLETLSHVWQKQGTFG